MARCLRDCPCARRADPVTGDTAGGLYHIQPCRLTFHVFRHGLVPVRTRELALVRDVEHRVPVDCRVVLRRGRGVRRSHCVQIEQCARSRLNLRRIDQPVAAHPDTVISLGEVGHHVAALIVGDNDLGELGRQFGRLGDDPHTRFRPIGAGDHAADIGFTDAHGFGSALLGTRVGRRRGQKCGKRNRHHGSVPASPRLHVPLPPVFLRQSFKGPANILAGQAGDGSILYSASLTCSAQSVPCPCSPFSDIARWENSRSGAAPCQCIVLGGIITVSPG